MNRITELWPRVQEVLSLLVSECQPVLTDRHGELILILEIIRVEEHVLACWWQHMGRKRKDRQALARAYLAKNYYNIATTRALLDRLRVDHGLRRICRWERVGD